MLNKHEGGNSLGIQSFISIETNSNSAAVHASISFVGVVDETASHRSLLNSITTLQNNNNSECIS